MKKNILLILLLLSTRSFSQQTTYDVLTFNAPEGWTKAETEKVNINFTSINQQTRSWCRFVVYKSTEGTGNLIADFNKEWNDLVVTVYNVTDPPVMSDSVLQNGWNTITGSGGFMFDNKQCSVTMKTFSANLRCASILVTTNDPSAYKDAINSFITSVNAAENVTPLNIPVTADINITPPKAISTSFQFNTTNFDDGWTSVVQEEWVEVVKGDVRVLLHYPHPDEKKYISQQDEHTRHFWNLLVAPRYSNLRNFELLNYNMSYEPGHFACGLLTDNKTGQDVWVTLFNKAKSGWIEIITKDKQSFVNAFGISNPDTYFSDWDPLVKLAGYNKFSVGEKDLAGKWSNEFSNSSYYYNVYTGIYAGASTYASRVTFIFEGNKKYKYEASSASGYSGTLLNVQQAKSAGTYKHVGNWQIRFSEIERKERLYNSYFSCVRGGRLLWLQDTGYGSYTAYGKID